MNTATLTSTPYEAFPGQGEVLILPVFSDDWQSDPHITAYDRLVHQSLTTKLNLMKFAGKKESIVTYEGLQKYSLTVVVGLGSRREFTLMVWRDALANALRAAKSYRLSEVTLFVNNLGTDYKELGRITAVAVHLTNYSYLRFKGTAAQEEIVPIQGITMTRDSKDTWDTAALETGYAAGVLESTGVCLTRDLVNDPAMTLGVAEMVQVARDIAAMSKGKITIEILDEEDCREMGMGSYLAVAQGSAMKPKFVVLHRKSVGKGHLAVVGKSIIFDTGGLSLKPPDAMIEMKMDMAGGATVLGLFRVLAEWDEKKYGRIPVSISGVLPICENMPSGTAMRPGDIVTAMNGKTIEILNTDAEGRLTLADGLVYAEKKLQADHIIDIATLTGACMVALGKEIAGMLGTNEEFLNRLNATSKSSAELLWPLPMHEGYLHYMKSDIADLQNIGGGRWGGVITAALFLREFVESIPWIHLDIAGVAFNDEKPKGINPKGATGWGVMTLLKMILDWK